MTIQEILTLGIKRKKKKTSFNYRENVKRKNIFGFLKITIKLYNKPNNPTR